LPFGFFNILFRVSLARKSVKIESLIAQISTQSNRQFNESKKSLNLSPEETVKTENTRKLRHLFESEPGSKKDESSGRKFRSSSVV
jgi:hypothetical protein